MSGINLAITDSLVEAPGEAPHFPVQTLIANFTELIDHCHRPGKISTVNTFDQFRGLLLQLFCHLWIKAAVGLFAVTHASLPTRSEEHTSELQSRENLVCR